MSQLLKYSYCSKDFSILYLMTVFIISVVVFNVSQLFTRGSNLFSTYNLWSFTASLIGQFFFDKINKSQLGQQY